jgi:hypothetical protein
MYERLGGTRNDVNMTHIEVINGTEGSPAWLHGPLDTLYYEGEMNQEQAKELLSILRGIDAKMDVLVDAALKPTPPVIGAGVLPRAEEDAAASKKR